MTESALSVVSERVIDDLHMEAVLLADETRAYFDGPGRQERDALPPRERVVFACEALKATTRLLQLVDWLSASRGDAPLPGRFADRLESGEDLLGRLPSNARRMVMAGIELHHRVGRIAEGHEPGLATISPARALIERIERTY